MKVLVVGSGAREHALVLALLADPSVDAVIAAPGNPGIARIAACEPIAGSLTESPELVAVARKHEVDLVVIGPEAPLVDGVADDLRHAGFATFGPSAQAAQLEGSKAFAKRIMAEAGVPTALAHVCTTMSEVADAIDAFGTPYVVKDDGLAAGKGVLVTDVREDALAHAAATLARPDGRIVVEEYLEGPEVSLFCLSDGEEVVALSPAQDFKRLDDGDAGPNTGGMGAYSPLPWAPHDLADDILERVARPTIRQMALLGMPFAGVLYVGLALTVRGPRVIEFNVRFGDPETQVVLARLRTPLAGLLYAAATGHLADAAPPTWREESAVTVVLAAQGYPTAPVVGHPITGLDEAGEDTSYVLHAGTSHGPEGIVSAGGRVLSVVGLGADLAAARAAAYARMERIALPGGHFRRDIALAAQRDEIRISG
ncbi:phosphoribosylamine--glycine ligase [Nostocoides sp.]|uniref:phosphoribosylamine--glycine ligase n=1 Tax=Nostocoides sp. TaxID=1917966 RepID=UPI002C1BC129|nr:phosphoribosylamine--glycine ligase [Tetrasphaera sp.]